MAHPWPVIQQVDAVHIKFQGKTLVYFGGCDYLRMSWHPEVRQGLRRGLDQYGLNVAASRGTTGNHPLYQQLEDRLAQFFGFPDAIFVSNGYMASLAAGQALAGLFDEVVMDSSSHACLRDAAALVTTRVHEFPHGTPPTRPSLRRMVSKDSRALLLTDGLFSQTGFIAPLPEWSKSLRRGDWLLVDDAHGVGVLGKNGQGTLEWSKTDHPRILLTATLSKAFGVYGGLILGPPAMLNRIRERSRMLIGNTPLPLPLVAAALVSLRVMKKSARARQRLFANADYLKKTLGKGGWQESVSSPAPIVFGTPRSAPAADRLAKALERAGIYPCHIHYPGATPGGYFRFAISSEHQREHLDALAAILLEERASLQEQSPC